MKHSYSVRATCTRCLSTETVKQRGDYAPRSNADKKWAILFDNGWLYTRPLCMVDYKYVLCPDCVKSDIERRKRAAGHVGVVERLKRETRGKRIVASCMHCFGIDLLEIPADLRLAGYTYGECDFITVRATGWLAEPTPLPGATDLYVLCPDCIRGDVARLFSSGAPSANTRLERTPLKESCLLSIR